MQLQLKMSKNLKLKCNVLSKYYLQNSTNALPLLLIYSIQPSTK